MVWVPGGSFQMGNDAFANAGPEHPVTVKGFWIDKPLGVVLGFYRPDWYLNFPGNNLQGPMDSFDPNKRHKTYPTRWFVSMQPSML